MVISIDRGQVESVAGLDVQLAFREAMATVCSPVSVVTTTLDGAPHGTTVSAFSSLSMEPPMLLVALDLSSQSLEAISKSGVFGLNVLGSEQAGDALAFARKGGAEKFENTSWDFAGGVPRLLGASSFLRCELAQAIEGGDHVILMGRVLDAMSSEDAPLTYFKRTFGTHSPF